MLGLVGPATCPDMLEPGGDRARLNERQRRAGTPQGLPPSLKRHTMQRKSAAQRHIDFLNHMMLASIAGLGLVAAGIAYAANAADQAHNAPPSAVQSNGWRIVQYYKGDAFVIDHGLTHDDCDDMLPRNQAAKGLSFACELGA